MAMGCMKQEWHQFDMPFVEHQVWMTQLVSQKVFATKNIALCIIVFKFYLFEHNN